jgi:hypothetical protein
MGQQRICMACSSTELGGSAHLSFSKKSRGEWAILLVSLVCMPLICILAVSAVSTWFWLSRAGLQSGYHLRLRWQEVMSRIISTDPGRGWMLLRWTCCSSTGMFTHEVTITVIISCCILCVPSSMPLLTFVGQFHYIHPKRLFIKMYCNWIRSCAFANCHCS